MTLQPLRLMRRLLPAAVGAALATNLPAAVVYSGGQNIAIPNSFNGIYLDFTDGNNAATVGQSYTNPGTWDLNLFYGGAGLWNSDTLQPVTAAAATNAAVLKLSTSDMVSGSSTFPPLSPGFSGSTGHMGVGAQQWQDIGETGYIGFRMLPASFTSNAPSMPVYGWMHVTLQGDGSSGIIHGWAWDPSGDPVLIPEPATVALAALSLAGCVLLRQKRPPPRR